MLACLTWSSNLKKKRQDQFYKSMISAPVSSHLSQYWLVQRDLPTCKKEVTSTLPSVSYALSLLTIYWLVQRDLPTCIKEVAATFNVTCELGTLFVFCYQIPSASERGGDDLYYRLWVKYLALSHSQHRARIISPLPLRVAKTGSRLRARVRPFS